MKARIEVECTPEEARAFLGLPDVSELNQHLVGEMKKRIDASAPEELLKSWMSFGSTAQEQFMRMMTSAAQRGFSGGTKAPE